MPTDPFATRRRSSSECTARSRLRSSVACSNSSAAAAARIRASRSRSIVLKRPDRKSITPSMLLRYSSFDTYPTQGAPQRLM